MKKGLSIFAVLVATAFVFAGIISGLNYLRLPMSQKHVIVQSDVSRI